MFNLDRLSFRIIKKKSNSIYSKREPISRNSTRKHFMPGKSLSWAASLVGLVALILIIVAIIVIRQTWNDINRRELGMVWLYIAAGAVFVAALMMAIAAELRPNTCQLKYSNRIIETSQLAI